MRPSSSYTTPRQDVTHDEKAQWAGRVPARLSETGASVRRGLADVRTSNYEGKLRRRGRFTGYASDWKKAYVRLQEGQKVPEYADI